jgi:hypothetical protein
MIVTEHEFELPVGYLDDEGTLHRKGTMRLATAADEIAPMADPRVQRTPAYLIVILLSRVVTRLGTVTPINPGMIERLFSQDVAYLQALYNRINGLQPEPTAVRCPNCEHEFSLETQRLGGSSATPLTASVRR